MITENTTARRHSAVVKEVNEILNQEAERSKLSWDPSKETVLDFKRIPRISHWPDYRSGTSSGP